MADVTKVTALVEFLNARLDEDEAVHVSGWDSPRVLADIAAKRAMIGDESDGLAMIAVHERGIGWPQEATRLADEMLRQLASVYADHPDYQQEWKPSAGCAGRTCAHGGNPR